MHPFLSFRGRILLIVLAGAVVPMALVGLWLTSTAARSGEELLRARLTDSLDRTAAEIGGNWVRVRYDLLHLAEEDGLQATLRRGPAAAAAGALPVRMSGDLPGTIEWATARDAAGLATWTLLEPAGSPGDGDGFGNPAIAVELGIYDRATGTHLGTLEASVRMSALLSDRARASVAAGSVIAALDSRNGAALLPLPFDAGLLSADRFVWAGEPWLAERRMLGEPPVQLVAAAPLAAFTQPFEEAANQGAWVLLAVAAIGMLLAAALTGRLTRSLERLAAAAEAVSRGDLDRKVDEDREDEVGRVARAFNAMTESLRRTLRQLAGREALAAVGEFAASLAHEIRNPLTSIRLDLQVVEEQLPPDSPLRHMQGQALREIERLDRTVGGALLVARSGRIALAPVNLLEPLRAAVHAARPEFDARGAALTAYLDETDPLVLLGDVGALEQLFLNLLLNAAQALEPGGRAEIEARLEEAGIVVSVRDDGPGIPPEMRDRVFEPFFSTRADGTGLGLAIAQRIVRAHQGEIEFESRPGAGTAVHVRFSRDSRVSAPLPPLRSPPGAV